MSSRIQTLVEDIKRYSKSYYEGITEISDEEFDALVEELRTLDQSNAILHTPGYGYVTSGKVDHYSYVTGIPDKRKVSPDYSDMKGYITPKFDGGSVELQYDKGVLVNAVTRGNGYQGQSVYSKLKVLVPNEIPYTGKISILGEFIISKENLDKYYADQLAFRNIPNGFLNRKEFDIDECKRFSFIAYKIGYSENQLASMVMNLISKLEEFGFLVPKCVLDLIESRSFKQYFDELGLDEVEGQHYYCDGLVVNNGINYKEDGSYQYVDERAYKIISQTAITKINDVEWNMSKFGNYIPVVKLDSVELSGAVISRVSGNNYKSIIDNKLGIGAEVEIVRSGEVIPYILRVVKPSEDFNNPKICEHCGEELTYKGVHLHCPNPECPAKTRMRVKNYLSYFAGYVKGIGSELLDAIIDTNEFDSIYDIYDKEIDIEKLRDYPGIGESKLNLVKELRHLINESPVDFRDVMIAINVPGLGYKNVDTILKYRPDFCKDIQLGNTQDIHYYDRIPRLSYSTKQYLVDYFIELIRLILCIERVVGFQKVEAKDNFEDNRIKVCITGKLSDGTKSQFYEKYQDKIVESDVKDCDILVCNNLEKKSGKLNKAIKLRKTVLTEQELVGELE